MAEQTVFVFFETADLTAAMHAVHLIEGGRNIPIDKKWSYRSERSHHDPNVTHLHLKLRGNDVAVVNKDGTMSHKTTLEKVPKRIMQYVRDKKLTEGMLIESSAANIAVVPPEVIRIAIRHEKLFRFFKPVLFWRR